MGSSNNYQDKKSSKAHIPGSENSRKTPQQQRSRVTVEAILEAAGLLLAKKGYAASSTNAIARRAGVSIGSLYQYFPNKDSIFLALMERHHTEMRPIKTKAVSELAEGRSAGAVLEEVMRESLAVRNRDPELMAAMHRELAGLAEKHGLEGEQDSSSGENVLSRVFNARRDMPDTHNQERAWLMVTILEAVGRKMVHQNLSNLDQETLISMTVEACESLLVDDSVSGRK
jgi:AcrR family transcriptional regulator